MKLTYRGIEYDYDAPAVEYGDALASGKYRGLDIRFRNAKKVPVYTATLDLQYRGVNSGSSNSVSKVDGAIAPQPSTLATVVVETANTVVDTVDNLARSLMLDQSRSIKRRQQDMLSRLAIEVGVPTDEVEHDWSKIQGKIHPTFRTNYERSGAAMS